MNKYQHLAAIALVLVALGCTTARQTSNSQAGAAVTSEKLKKLAEGVISTGEDYGPTFTPDGQTVYFARRINGRRSASIYVSRVEQGKWSAPQVAEFSGQFYDVEPFITPDGSKLFFASRRPVDGTTPNKEFDLWVMEKQPNGWGTPQHLPAPINSDGYENYPSVSRDGTLYFGSSRDGGQGKVDLYRAKLVNGTYSQIENLGAPINTASSDADPYIMPDESAIIFSSSRPGGLGEGDLYISFNQGGKWTEPRTLGEKVNSQDWDYTPWLSPDRKTFLFSRGWGDIYQIETSELNLAQ